ncbi:Oidioi.mRNA.OKI2018_I69.PAR.g11435.t1.cds [Oikopleura dioica]|uniref:Oidioi.mRNA.OKI2018_I69.PAR.g11435.t1.cds n=1 Tax=Oikopleura dioica TaxID=34765 RepID=A0ABN7RVK6_OIKDI|nr:Oidioi.mRNA.OKI2018_I69.PAR.g11435.t1.cds [Oikopleura dioica]
MPQCRSVGRNRELFGNQAEIAITPSTGKREEEIAQRIQKENDEIEVKLGRNVESEKLLKKEKKEGDVGGRNREIVMLLLWILMVKLNSTKSEKNGEEEDENVASGNVKNEIPTKQKRNAGNGKIKYCGRRKRSESKSRRTTDGMSRQMSKMTLNDDADGLDAEERRERRREKKRRSRSKIRSKDPSEIPADDLEALIKASHRARDRSTDGQIRRKKKTRDPSTKRNRNRHHDQSTERPSAQV